MSRYKVLMLGWSHESEVNAGLGNACMSLCRNLSKKANIVLLLPKAPEHALADETIVIETSSGKSAGGSPESAPGPEWEYAYHVNVHNIDIALDPYFHPGSARSLSEALSRIKKAREKRQPAKEGKSHKNHKSISHNIDLYDDDMLERVLQYAHEVLEIAKNQEFDLIHAHDWMTFLAGIYVKDATGKPLLLHVHSLDYDRAAGDVKSWVFDIERYSLSKADLVVPVSNYTAEIIYSRYGLSSRMVYPVHNGLEPVDMKPKKPGIGTKTVLFAGRITGQKGWRYFLEIALLISQKYKDVKFIVAGDGPEMDDITKSEIVESLGDKMEIMGHIDRNSLKKLFSVSDVYLMPSVSEPFGLTALEAVQAGIPVVLSRRSGVSEVLTSAPKADFTDIEGMAKLVLRLLNDDKHYIKVTKKLQEEAGKNTVEKSVKKLLKIYDKLLQ